MCSPAEIFVLVHGQQRFSDGPTCRLRLLPPAAPVVQGYSSEVNIVRTYPLSCKHLRSISKKKKRKSLSRLVFRVRRQGFLYRPRPPVAAVVQGFSSEFHVLEQSVRILCLANEVGLQLSIVCFQPVGHVRSVLKGSNPMYSCHPLSQIFFVHVLCFGGGTDERDEVERVDRGFCPLETALGCTASPE